MKTNRKTVLSLILVLSAAISSAQEFNVSPYSIFGIGDLQLGESSQTAGMASAGISLSGGRFLNTSNPASLSALDSTTFLFDFSGSARGSLFTSGNIKQKAFGANFTKIAAGMHVTPRWSTALTVQPFSTVSYKIESEDYIEGSETTTTTLFEGSGGMTRLSFLNSFRLTPHFSLGGDIMLLFGNIDRNAQQSGITINQTSTSSAIMFNLGLQYTERLSPGLLFAAGVVYGHGGTLKFVNILRVLDESNSTLFDNNIASSKMTIPDTYATGFSLISDRFVVAADYRYQKWSVTRDQIAGMTFTDTHSVNAGMAFTPATAAARSYFKLVQYQAGVSLSNSYLTLNNINPLNIELTAGAGLPFRNGSKMTVAFAWGKRGTTDEGLIRENYMRMTLCISFAERWFMKRMYE